jgi:ppGpp synthetase/RelA/SpoT-type nucleotidyltranferase
VANEISKTQIDRLGDRLKKGNITEEDLRLLDEYRRSFALAYNHVVESIRDTLGLEPTGRPAKSTTSISEKLRRESIRLTQIQDIAGCRVVVPDIARQDHSVSSIRKLFKRVVAVDRREKPRSRISQRSFDRQAGQMG